MFGWEKVGIVVVTTLPLMLGGIGIALVTPNTADLNRAPLGFPKLSISSTRDAAYFSNMGTALSDRLALRQTLRGLNSWVQFNIFADDPADRVIWGRDRWLFLGDAIDKPLVKRFRPDTLHASLSDLSRIGSAERRFYIAIAPNKSAIYPDYLGEANQAAVMVGRERLDAFGELEGQSPILGYIDLVAALESERVRVAPQPVYYPQDTHWNGLGAAVLVREIVKDQAPGLWSDDAIVRAPDLPRVYDLSRMAALLEIADEPNYVAERPGVSITRTNREAGIVQFDADSSGPALLPSIVVLHDSFGEALKDVMPPWFKMTTFIHHRATGTKEARQLISSADSVVYELVQRNVYARGVGARSRSWGKDLEGLLSVPKTAH